MIDHDTSAGFISGILLHGLDKLQFVGQPYDRAIVTPAANSALIKQSKPMKSARMV